MDRFSKISPEPPPTHAVFIDGDWLASGVRNGNIPLSYIRLMSFFKKRFGNDVAVRMYLSIRPKNPGTTLLIATLAELGIAVQTISMEHAGKSSIDMHLAVDAAALPADVTTFALLSGDLDFIPLLRRMKERGCTTVLVSFPLMLSSSMRDAADEFINLETIVTGKHSRGAKSESTRTLRQASHVPPSQVLIDKGEHLRPYLFFRNLLVAAQKDVSIIDPYLGVELFELFACLQMRIGVTMITDQKHVPADLGALVSRCRKEGRQMRVFSSRDIHDRYLRIDDDWWHSGHSFKDLGSRVSQVTRVDTKHLKQLRQIERRSLEEGMELFPPRSPAEQKSR